MYYFHMLPHLTGKFTKCKLFPIFAIRRRGYMTNHFYEWYTLGYT